MNNHGYTLVETLVALAMIAMAIGGLTLGVGVIGRAQLKAATVIAQAEATRLAQVSLERVLQAQGAFRTQDGGRLTGSASEIAYVCGSTQPCHIVLKEEPDGLGLDITEPDHKRHIDLRTRSKAKFVYQGAVHTSDAWPPGGTEREALRGIELVRLDDARPILVAKLWAEQPAKCDFDVVMQDCR